jgi:hypothetical protein
MYRRQAGRRLPATGERSGVEDGPGLRHPVVRLQQRGDPAVVTAMRVDEGL